MKSFGIGYIIGWFFGKVIGGIFRLIIAIFKGIFGLFGLGPKSTPDDSEFRDI